MNHTGSKVETTVLVIAGRSIDIDTAIAKAHAYPAVTVARYDLPGPGPAAVITADEIARTHKVRSRISHAQRDWFIRTAELGSSGPRTRWTGTVVHPTETYRPRSRRWTFGVAGSTPVSTGPSPNGRGYRRASYSLKYSDLSTNPPIGILPGRSGRCAVRCAPTAPTSRWHGRSPMR